MDKFGRKDPLRDAARVQTLSAGITNYGASAGTDADTVDGYHAVDFLSPSYVVVSTDPNLTNERVVAEGAGIDVADGGAGSNLTFSIDQSFTPTWTGQHTFTRGVIIDGSQDEVQLRIDAHSTQTSNMTTWRSSGGTVIAAIDRYGYFFTGYSVATGTIAGDFYRSTAATSGSQIGARGAARFTGSSTTSATFTGFDGTAESAAIGSINVATLIGVSGTATISSGTGTTTNLIGARFTASSASSGASVTSLIGVDIQISELFATVATAYGLKITDTQFAGSVTTKYGIKVENIATATNNYSLYTGTGLVRFGDNTYIDGSRDQVQLMIDGYVSQSLDLVQLRNSGGVILARFDVNGYLGIQTAPTYPLTVNGQSYHTFSTSTTGTLIGHYFYTTRTGETGSLFGLLTRARAQIYNGNAGYAYGLRSIGSAYNNASDNMSTGDIVAGYFEPEFILTGTGNLAVSGSMGVSIASPTITASGGGTLSVTNQRGIFIANQGNAYTTNAYGIFINGQSGSTNNYALYTAGGYHLFGDRVILNGSQDILQFKVHAHSTQTQNLVLIDSYASSPYFVMNGSGNIGLKANPSAGYDFYVYGNERIQRAGAQLRLTYNGGSYYNVDFYATVDGHLQVTTTAGASLKLENAAIQSLSWVSGTTGWHVSYAGAADFRSITADELYVETFIYDVNLALAGSEILAKSLASLSRDFTVPATTGTLYVYELPGIAGNVFADGDAIRLRYIDHSSGLTVSDVWGTVVSVIIGDEEADEQAYTFTRGYGTAGWVIPASSWALDYGVSGDGIIHSTVLDASGAPYIEIATWVTDPSVGGNWTTHVRLGSIEGITSVDEYGLFAGDGVTDADQFIRLTDTNFEIHNVPLEIHDGTNPVIVLDNSTPYISVGATAPTAYRTGTGFWVGNDSGTYKFHLGDPTAAHIYWDGSSIYNFAASGYYSVWQSSAFAIVSGGVTTIYISASGNARFGSDTGATPNLYYNGTALQMREGSTVYASLTSSTLTLGLSTQDNIQVSSTGILLYDNGTVRGKWETDGDIFIGSNISSPGTTYFSIFATAQTYNSESVAAGDMLIGDNSASKANIYWDYSAGRLLFRGGTSEELYIDTDGTLTAGSGLITLNSTGMKVYGVAAPYITFFSSGDYIASIGIWDDVSTYQLKLGARTTASTLYGSMIILEPLGDQADTSVETQFIVSGHSDYSSTDGYFSFRAGAALPLIMYVSTDYGSIDVEWRVGGRVEEEGTFGELYVHDSSTAQTIATGSTYTKSTCWTFSGQSSNCTPSAANDKITITHTGRYLVVGSFSFKTDTNNVNVLGSIFLNGSEQNHLHFRRKVGTAGDEGAATLSGFVDVTTASWDLDFRLRHDYGSDVDITITYANLSVLYVGET